VSIAPMATSNISSIHPTSQASTQIVETTIPVAVSGRELQRRHRMQMLRASRGSRPTMTLAGSVWLDRCHTHVSSSFTGSASIDRIAENERRLVPASPSRLYIARPVPSAATSVTKQLAGLRNNHRPLSSTLLMETPFGI
jgi:hypothetical protein